MPQKPAEPLMVGGQTYACQRRQLLDSPLILCSRSDRSSQVYEPTSEVRQGGEANPLPVFAVAPVHGSAH